MNWFFALKEFIVWNIKGLYEYDIGIRKSEFVTKTQSPWIG